MGIFRDHSMFRGVKQFYNEDRQEFKAERNGNEFFDFYCLIDNAWVFLGRVFCSERSSSRKIYNKHYNI